MPMTESSPMTDRLTRENLHGVWAAVATLRRQAMTLTHHTAWRHPDHRAPRP